MSLLFTVKPTLKLVEEKFNSFLKSHHRHAEKLIYRENFSIKQYT